MAISAHLASADAAADVTESSTTTAPAVATPSTTEVVQTTQATQATPAAPAVSAHTSSHGS
jgi:hypothetical protein